MKLFKIKANENLIAIFHYIQTYQYKITLLDLVQFCIDYDYYKEFYEHFHIIYRMVQEHNQFAPDNPNIAASDENSDDDNLL